MLKRSYHKYIQLIHLINWQYIVDYLVLTVLFKHIYLSIYILDIIDRRHFTGLTSKITLAYPVINIATIKASCSNCNLQEICVPRGLGKQGLEELDRLVQKSKLLHKGDFLFRSGEEFKALYAVKLGSVKIYIIDKQGVEQIVGFYFPGEILGLDGIEHHKHSCYASAMETSSLCPIPYSDFSEVCLRVPDFQEQMFRLLSKEFTHENKMLLSINNKNSEEKIATFLSSLAFRFKKLGYSDKEFYLPMSRQEIGNYLGLRIETVSRVFTKFQKKELIELQKKLITIKDNALLEDVCTGSSRL